MCGGGWCSIERVSPGWCNRVTTTWAVSGLEVLRRGFGLIPHAVGRLKVVRSGEEFGCPGWLAMAAAMVTASSGAGWRPDSRHWPKWSWAQQQDLLLGGQRLEAVAGVVQDGREPSRDPEGGRGARVGGLGGIGGWAVGIAVGPGRVVTAAGAGL